MSVILLKKNIVKTNTRSFPFSSDIRTHRQKKLNPKNGQMVEQSAINNWKTKQTWLIVSSVQKTVYE